MPLLITLRRNPESSPFRRQLQRLCRLPAPGDLILCSGYIWEPESGYSVLEDDLLECIAVGCHGKTVTTIAGKLQKSGYIDWLQHYKNFVARLQRAGIAVRPYIVPRRNWHAKIAIKLDGIGQPLAAIVGSSNLTGPAYREGWRTWNYESDVTIWRPNAGVDSHLNSTSEQIPNPYEEITCVLDPHTPQPTKEERLQALYRDVFREKEGFMHLEEYEG